MGRCNHLRTSRSRRRYQGQASGDGADQGKHHGQEREDRVCSQVPLHCCVAGGKNRSTRATNDGVMRWRGGVGI
jgi:hypothetical protein